MVHTKRGIASQFGKAWRALRRHYEIYPDLYQLEAVRVHPYGSDHSFLFHFMWDESPDTSWCDYYIHDAGKDEAHYCGTFCVGADRIYEQSVYTTFYEPELACERDHILRDESDVETYWNYILRCPAEYFDHVVFFRSDKFGHIAAVSYS